MLDHSANAGRHTYADRGADAYDTPPVAVHALLRIEQLPHCIWEPCCGSGNIVKILRGVGHHVIATDLNDRGCPGCSTPNIDFLLPVSYPCDAIVTNPPFKFAERFVKLATMRAPLVIMLLRFAFYEGDRRTEILEHRGLARIHVFRKRLPMMHRAGWDGPTASSAIAFAWYVWDSNHKGPTTIDRISWER